MAREQIARAFFEACKTGPGGPVAPRGKPLASDCAHVMQFDGDRIGHMTEIWNDAQALRRLGWAS